jgi:P-type E1-E2 ATPase
VAIDVAVAGAIRCSDPLRADAVVVVNRVRTAGARPVLLSGDAPEVAAQVAQTLAEGARDGKDEPARVTADSADLPYGV